MNTGFPNNTFNLIHGDYEDNLFNNMFLDSDSFDYNSEANLF